MENVNSCFLLQRDTSDSFLSDYLKQAYVNSVFSDVVVASSDMRFRAHRCVLAASSQFFRDILTDAPNSDIYIILPDYSGDQIKRVLEFIYTGATTSGIKNEPDLVELLTDLEIGGCTDVRISDHNLSPEFPAEVLSSNKKKTAADSASNSAKFTCKVCGQFLKTRTGLRLHLLTHEGTKGKAFTCDVCGKGFSQASQLKTHLRTHTKEKPHMCDVCARPFSHASSLAEHKNLHSSIKPFQCNICGQSFAHRKALRSHQCQGDHAASNKTFPCPFCKRTFTSKRGLAVHGMHQHAQASPEPILKCDVCEMTFTSEASYEVHITNHMET